MAEKEFFPSFLGRSKASAILFFTYSMGVGPGSSVTIQLYWWVELNFGQEPVFLKRPYFKLIPEKLFSTTKLL